jgi:hypothetical protein
MSKCAEAAYEIQENIELGYDEAAAWADDIDTDSPEWFRHAPAAIIDFCYGERFEILMLYGMGSDIQRNVGHDLWLTRQGHGAGFWDKTDDFYGSAEIRDAMDAAARDLGEVHECFDYIEGSERWLDEQEARAAE